MLGKRKFNASYMCDISAYLPCGEVGPKPFRSVLGLPRLGKSSLYLDICAIVVYSLGQFPCVEWPAILQYYTCMKFGVSYSSHTDSRAGCRQENPGLAAN